MSLYSICTGMSLMGYGIYKGISVCSRGLDKRYNEVHDFGAKEIIAGTTLIAAGTVGNLAELFFGALSSMGQSAEPSSSPLAGAPSAEDLAAIAYQNAVSLAAAPCVEQTIDRLRSILSADSDSMTSKMFRVFNETVGITCENYLPWKEKFHLGGTGYIDGVFKDDLPSSSGWGIDPAKRPFIALKYECLTNDAAVTKPAVGAFALFQRYTNVGDLVAKGEHGRVKYCPPYALDGVLRAWSFLDDLKKFFQGEPLANNLMRYEVAQIKLADK